jgi:hypothetical protein
MRSTEWDERILPFSLGKTRINSRGLPRVSRSFAAGFIYDSSQKIVDENSY